MDNTNTIIIFLSCIVAIIILGKVFIWPLKSIIKLIINSILGGVLIAIINYFGTSFNFHIGLNILTALFVGILGIPGAILLSIIKLFIG